MRISKELGLDQRGEILLRREGRRLEAVREQADRLRRPTVVALEWTDPIFPGGLINPRSVDGLGRRATVIQRLGRALPRGTTVI